MTVCRVYGQALAGLVVGAVDVADLWVMLTDATYVPHLDVDAVRADVSGQITATGYTAGGQAAPATATYDATQDELTVALTADPSWPTFTYTGDGIRYAVFYADTGSSATDPLLCVWDFEEDLTPTAAATFAPAQPLSGLLTARIVT